MLASNRCSGLVTSWCATHAMIHSCRTVSPVSLRESVPGAVASGQVCRMASPVKNARVAAVVAGRNARGSVTGRLGDALVNGEVRPRPHDLVEAIERDEEHVE